MRRLISEAVEVRPAPAFDLAVAFDAAIQGDQPLKASLPTESEVRDALAKVTKKLDDSIQPYSVQGWHPVDGQFTFRMIELDDRSIALRGYVVIERKD